MNVAARLPSTQGKAGRSVSGPVDKLGIDGDGETRTIHRRPQGGAGAPPLEPQGIMGHGPTEVLRAWDAVHAVYPDGRCAVLGYRAAGGARLMVDGARVVRTEWRVRPWVLADRLDGCALDHVATFPWLTGLPLTGPTWAPCRCKSRFCEACVAREALRVGDPLAIEGEALARAGCPVLMATLTQSPRTEWHEAPHPVILTPAEVAAGWRPSHGAPATGTGWAVEGQGLAVELADLMDAWREVRHEGAGARWWRRTVLGAIYRWEATGSEGGVPGVPRWHAHLHATVWLYPTVRVRHLRPRGGETPAGGPWVARLRYYWLRAVRKRSRRASARAQHVTVVRDTGAGLRKAIAYTIKYPWKLAMLTTAQRLEAMAVVIGRKAGFRCGVLHSRSLQRRAVLARQPSPDHPPRGWRGALALALHELATRPRRAVLYREGAPRDLDLDRSPTVAAAPSIPHGVVHPGTTIPWFPVTASWLADDSIAGPRWVGWRHPDGTWTDRRLTEPMRAAWLAALPDDDEDLDPAAGHQRGINGASTGHQREHPCRGP